MGHRDRRRGTLAAPSLTLNLEKPLAEVLVDGEPAIVLHLDVLGQVQLRFLDHVPEAERERLEAHAIGWVKRLGPTLGRLLYEMPSERICAMGRAAVAGLPPERLRRLHFGPGPDLREGWLNIDYLPAPTGGLIENGRLLNYDLRKGVPVPDGAAEIIYSSHFFEHLYFDDAGRLLADCHRALAPGGVLRTALPNYRALFEAYVAGDKAFLQRPDQREMVGYMPLHNRHFADLLSRWVYEFDQHRYIYDVENFSALLEAVGFTGIHEDVYRPEIDISWPERISHSFYVVATR